VRLAIGVMSLVVAAWSRGLAARESCPQGGGPLSGLVTVAGPAAGRWAWPGRGDGEPGQRADGLSGSRTRLPVLTWASMRLAHIR
jgi:hypothetical protein